MENGRALLSAGFAIAASSIAYLLLWVLCSRRSRRSRKGIRRIRTSPKTQAAGKILGVGYLGGYLAILLATLFRLSQSHQFPPFLQETGICGMGLSIIMETFLAIAVRRSALPARDIILAAASNEGCSPAVIRLCRFASPAFFMTGLAAQLFS